MILMKWKIASRYMFTIFLLKDSIFKEYNQPISTLK